MATLISLFFIFSCVIVISGYMLSKCAQALSKKTIFSEAIFGMVFLAIITSLPEVITSIGSITLIKAPDLAASTAFGSILINLMIIAVLDFLQGKGGILSVSDKKHILTSGLTIVILGLIILMILFRFTTNIQLGIFNIGLDSFLIMLLYVLCVKLAYGHNKQEEDKLKVINNTGGLWLKFLLLGAAIIISGLFLSKLGEEIVIETGLSETFVGLVFLAVVTSLPELIVSITALRLGSIDMAVGNVLGSNLFDAAIIPICDVFYRQGQILSSISLIHIVTLSLCVIFSAIIIIGLTYRGKKSFLKLGWDIIAMVIIFIMSVFFFYLMR